EVDLSRGRARGASCANAHETRSRKEYRRGLQSREVRFRGEIPMKRARSDGVRLIPFSCVLVAFVVTAPIAGQDPPASSRRGRSEPAAGLAALGERLFRDPRLSRNRSTSCASCHRPETSFTDGRSHAAGSKGEDLGRNTATLLGLASVQSFPIWGSL